MISWDARKEEWLLRERGLSFDAIARHIEEGRFLDVIVNPAYDGQRIFIISIGDYIHAVPFELNGDIIILKTVYPSRKYHKMYRKRLK